MGPFFQPVDYMKLYYKKRKYEVLTTNWNVVHAKCISTRSTKFWPPADRKALRAYTNGEAPGQCAAMRRVKIFAIGPYIFFKVPSLHRRTAEILTTARMRRLIWFSVVCTCSKVPFSQPSAQLKLGTYPTNYIIIKWKEYPLYRVLFMDEYANLGVLSFSAYTVTVNPFLVSRSSWICYEIHCTYLKYNSGS